MLGLHPNERNKLCMRTSNPDLERQEFQLTDDQLEALDQIRDFLKISDRSFLLTGQAGTGKTTVIAQLAKLYPSIKFVFTAPTNKATKVLYEIASETGVEIPCMTLHKLLGLVVQSDASEKYAASRRTSYIPYYDVIVVDECSMVGNKSQGKYESVGLYARLIQEVEKYGRKVVFVGDPNQLPPVNEDTSPTLKVEPSFALNEIVRQAQDNPIIQCADWVKHRLLGENTGRKPEMVSRNGIGVHKVSGLREYEELVIQHFEQDPSHPTKNKAIAWRWKAIDRLSGRIRQALFPEHVKNRFVPGERYYTTEPVLDIDDPESKSFHLMTDEDAILTDIYDCEHPNKKFGNFPTDKLIFDSGTDVFATYVVQQEYEKEYEKALSEKFDQAKRREIPWKQVWGMCDAYNWDSNTNTPRFRPHYATTVHRSQGSTYENVFVDAIDISLNRNTVEYWKLLYTACTRGAKNLYIFPPW